MTNVSRIDTRVLILISVLTVCATIALIAWLFRPGRWEYRHIGGTRAYRFDPRTGEAELVQLKAATAADKGEQAVKPGGWESDPIIEPAPQRRQQPIDKPKALSIDEAYAADQPKVVKPSGWESAPIIEPAPPPNLPPIAAEAGRSASPSGLDLWMLPTVFVEVALLSLFGAWIRSLFTKERHPKGFWCGGAVDWVKYNWIAVVLSFTLVVAMHVILWELQRQAMDAAMELYPKRR